jgi:putative endonuclease
MWPFRQQSGQPDLGRCGEQIALRFLTSRRGGRQKILARNYRCPEGEADLIVLDKSTRRRCGAETIAIVEVKTRSSDRHTDPQGAVNADKRRRMRSIARHYAASHDAEGYNIRFDIVAIVIRDGEKPQVDYIPDAF